MEIQLRTPKMHEWAESADAFSALLGSNFEQGGDSVVHRYMKKWSEITQVTERDGVPPRSALEEL